MTTLLANGSLLGLDRGGTRSLAIAATRHYTPFAFGPLVERLVVSVLAVAAVGLWFVLLPLELVLGLG